MLFVQPHVLLLNGLPETRSQTGVFLPVTTHTGSHTYTHAHKRTHKRTHACT